MARPAGRIADADILWPGKAQEIGLWLFRRDVVDPMQAGSAMPLFRQTPRRTLHGELIVRLLPQDFCHCQR